MYLKRERAFFFKFLPLGLYAPVLSLQQSFFGWMGEGGQGQAGSKAFRGGSKWDFPFQVCRNVRGFCSCAFAKWLCQKLLGADSTLIGCFTPQSREQWAWPLPKSPATRMYAIGLGSRVWASTWMPNLITAVFYFIFLSAGSLLRYNLSLRRKGNTPQWIHVICKKVRSVWHKLGRKATWSLNKRQMCSAL